MSHDPLCPIAPSPTTVNRIRELVEETPEGRAALERSAEQWCECSLIAEVRADEREKAAQRVRDYGAETHPPHSPGFGCLRCDIHAAYNHAAALIVRGEQ